MAFRNVATLIADGVSLDRQTGRLSVFNMLESVLAPSYPALLPKLVVVNVYEIDDGSGAYWERVTVVDDAGTELARVVAELRGEGTAHRSMGIIQGMRLAKPGVYSVVVEGATKRDGPWHPVNRRRLHAELGTHPLICKDEKNPRGVKVRPASITE